MPVETIVQERDRARQQLKALQEHLLQLESSFTEDALKRDDHIITLQGQIKRLTEESAAEIAQLSSRCHTLTLQLDTLEAEIVKARRSRDFMEAQASEAQAEVKRLTLTISNLDVVLQNFEAEKENAVSLVRGELEHKMDVLTSELGHAKDALVAHESCIATIAELEAQVQVLQGDIRENSGLRLALQHDVARLQSQLSEVHTRHQTALAGLVDKALIRNMVCGRSC